MMQRILNDIRIYILLGLFLCPLLLFAQSNDTFLVTQQIGADTTLPTTPAFITATPVASTQIDLAWGTSTDDLMGGYRLFRDAVQIATTTLTSYSDTGLTPSTTYSYTVNAFDSGFLTSTTTGPVATTTLAALTPPATTPESATGSYLVPRVTEFDIDATTNSAVFSWRTNVYTRYILKWGLGSSYELGFVQGGLYKRNHVTHIEGLDPETRYQYELIGYNQQGESFRLKQGEFSTHRLPDITAPANVTGLRAVVEGNAVYLRWNNPQVEDFAKVRVVRSHLFYPGSPTDGFIVYEGDSDSTLDSEAFLTHPEAYYTVFTYDATGNVSSGTIVRAQRAGTPSQPMVGVGGGATQESGALSGGSTGTKTDEASDGGAGGDSLDFMDIEFWQDDILLQHGNDNVTVRDDSPVTIRLQAKKVPSHVKTLTVKLTDRQGGTNAYILRLNVAKTLYESYIEVLPEGTYEAFFSLYDFKREQYVTFDGEVISASSKNALDEEGGMALEVLTQAEKMRICLAFPLFFLLLLIIWWFFFVLRRSAEDN